MNVTIELLSEETPGSIPRLVFPEGLTILAADPVREAFWYTVQVRSTEYTYSTQAQRTAIGLEHHVRLFPFKISQMVHYQRSPARNFPTATPHRAPNLLLKPKLETT